MALTWARRVVSDQEALSAEIAAARGQLTGVARIGTIPAGIALATAPGMFPEDQPSITGRMLARVPLGPLAWCGW
ncbi:hypothetical protein [Arthrobacter sp. RCC_34]|uniref:hypothetical protein n=1 Tax=Arthrobacter sp. RCC_34 TaxID=3239230 RepID=UPI003523737D